MLGSRGSGREAYKRREAIDALMDRRTCSRGAAPGECARLRTGACLGWSANHLFGVGAVLQSRLATLYACLPTVYTCVPSSQLSLSGLSLPGLSAELSDVLTATRADVYGSGARLVLLRGRGLFPLCANLPLGLEAGAHEAAVGSCFVSLV